MSIVAKNLTKVYGEQKALDNVNFEVKKGSVVGLLGPNGAGKSTIMKIITCFLPPTTGEVKVNGFDIATQSFEVRKSVGYLPENNPLYYDMYVTEYLEFIAGIHRLGKQSKQRVEEMIALTGLQPERHKKIAALSKGYKQRVGLAQALIHNPEVLILDEPTSGLDPNQLIEIRNLIIEIGKQKTVLFSTHIMQEVEAVCNSVILLNKGHIIAHNNTQDFTNLAKKTTYEVEFDGNIDVEVFAKLPSVLAVKPQGGNKYHLETEGHDDIRKLIAQTAQAHNWLMISLEKMPHSIESIFQELTK